MTARRHRARLTHRVRRVPRGLPPPSAVAFIISPSHETVVVFGSRVSCVSKDGVKGGRSKKKNKKNKRKPATGYT